jgi:hypothetical protein
MRYLSAPPILGSSADSESRRAPAFASRMGHGRRRAAAGCARLLPHPLRHAERERGDPPQSTCSSPSRMGPVSSHYRHREREQNSTRERDPRRGCRGPRKAGRELRRAAAASVACRLAP